MGRLAYQVVLEQVLRLSELVWPVKYVYTWNLNLNLEGKTCMETSQCGNTGTEHNITQHNTTQHNPAQHNIT